MSQMVTIKAKMANVQMLKKACEALKYDFKEDAEVKFYDHSTRRGTSVTIPGWKYPVVVESTGDLYYDNYEGVWGDIAGLNKLKQKYSVENSRRILIEQGLSVHETIDNFENVTLTACSY